jgi:glycosyltransferase involved in cell wall biosynthesis
VKILWHSNAPMVGSGYGVQSALFGPRIAGLGHDLAFSANWGVQGWTPEWDGFRIYPADGVWGNRTMAACAAHHAGALDECQVIALCDAFVLDTGVWPEELRIAIWAPVDHDPLPPAVRRVLAHEQVTPIAMSRFGERMMSDAGLEPLYVPHGVETDIFRPQPHISGDVREEMGLPRDAFVVGMVAANAGNAAVHRKAFPQAFQAFARFREKHPDAVLYVHTNEHPDPGGGGMVLRRVAQSCGLPRQAVVFTDVFAYEIGWSRATLANAYQAFDVLLNPALGEGFGVALIEAQAGGVPVIVTDCTAMTELCGAGWLVEGEQLYDAIQDSFFADPSMNAIVDALERAYNEAAGLKEQAREFALAYDADTVTEEFWEPALAALDVREQVAA